MKSKPKIKLKIIKEEQGYTAVGQWKNRSLITCGDNWQQLQNMIVEMLNFVFEDLGYNYTIDEIQLEYDLESFFEFYKVINAKALSERIGMNQSLLAQYIKGIKNLRRFKQNVFFLVCSKSVGNYPKYAFCFRR